TPIPAKKRCNIAMGVASRYVAVPERLQRGRLRAALPKLTCYNISVNVLTNRQKPDSGGYDNEDIRADAAKVSEDRRCCIDLDDRGTCDLAAGRSGGSRSRAV